jgi:chromosome segregation ATPase
MSTAKIYDLLLDLTDNYGIPAKKVQDRANIISNNIGTFSLNDIKEYLDVQQFSEQISQEYHLNPFLNRLFHLLPLLRNVFVLLPLIFTWYSIGRATQEYQQMLSDKNGVILAAGRSFLELWEHHFYQFGSYPFSSFASIDVFLFCLLIVIGIMADYVVRQAQQRTFQAQLDIDKICDSLIQESLMAQKVGKDPEEWATNVQQVLEKTTQQITLLQQTASIFAANTQSHAEHISHLDTTTAKMEQHMDSFEETIDKLSEMNSNQWNVMDTVLHTVEETNKQQVAQLDYLKQLANSGQQTVDIIERVSEWEKSIGQSLSVIAEQTIQLQSASSGLASTAKTYEEALKSLTAWTEQLTDTSQSQLLATHRLLDSTEQLEGHSINLKAISSYIQTLALHAEKMERQDSQSNESFQSMFNLLEEVRLSTSNFQTYNNDMVKAATTIETSITSLVTSNDHLQSSVATQIDAIQTTNQQWQKGQEATAASIEVLNSVINQLRGFVERVDKTRVILDRITDSIDRYTRHPISQINSDVQMVNGGFWNRTSRKAKEESTS